MVVPAPGLRARGPADVGRRRLRRRVWRSARSQSEITFLSSEDWWPDWATVGVAPRRCRCWSSWSPLFVLGRAPSGTGIGRRRPAAAGPDTPRPAAARRRVSWPCGFAALLLTDGSYRFGVITSMIVALIALSLVVLTGLRGPDLARAGGVRRLGRLRPLEDRHGAAVPALAARRRAGRHRRWALLVAVPALRVRGVQLAVVTLAAGVAIEQLVFQNPKLTAAGGNLIPDARIFGVDLAVRRGAELARWQFGVARAGRARAGRAGGGQPRPQRHRPGPARGAVERAGGGVDRRRRRRGQARWRSGCRPSSPASAGRSSATAAASSRPTRSACRSASRSWRSPTSAASPASAVPWSPARWRPLGIGYVVLDRSTDLGEHYLLVSGLLLVATAVLNPGGIAGSVRSGVTGRRRPPPEGGRSAATTGSDRRAGAEPPPVTAGAPS